jgi:hypothetical protein
MSESSYPINRSRSLFYLAATLSLVAALIHLWVMPEHFEEWWGYGTFFLGSAAAQALYAPVLLLCPNRTAVLLLGIGGNLAIVVLYVITRTVEIPFFGPHAGEVEGMGLADLCATASELGIVGALGGVLMMRRLTGEQVAQILIVLAVLALLFLHLVHLLSRAATH